MYDTPLIITCAVVGAELTKKEYPYLPVTPGEIADSAFNAYKAGASIIHLHVRDEQGKPTQRVDVFEEVTEKIRNKCDAIIQFSTGGAVGTHVDERCAPLKLKPDMASLTMGTFNFGSEIFENSEYTIMSITETIKKYNIMPELEIFDTGMLDSIDRYVKKNILPEKFHVDFVMGVPGGIKGTINNLVHLTGMLNKDQTWSVAGIGKYQLPSSAHAIAMGGHVRTGIEDNIYYSKGKLAKSNDEFVKRIARLAAEMDRPVADVKTARSLLGI